MQPFVYLFFFRLCIITSNMGSYYQDVNGLMQYCGIFSADAVEIHKYLKLLKYISIMIRTSLNEWYFSGFSESHLF